MQFIIGVKNFLTAMFGNGVTDYRGAVIPGAHYLYTFGDELDSIFDVLLLTPEKHTIAMVRVD